MPCWPVAKRSSPLATPKVQHCPSLSVSQMRHGGQSLPPPATAPRPSSAPAQRAEPLVSAAPNAKPQKQRKLPADPMEESLFRDAFRRQMEIISNTKKQQHGGGAAVSPPRAVRHSQQAWGEDSDAADDGLVDTSPRLRLSLSQRIDRCIKAVHYEVGHSGLSL